MLTYIINLDVVGGTLRLAIHMTTFTINFRLQMFRQERLVRHRKSRRENQLRREVGTPLDRERNNQRLRACPIHRARREDALQLCRRYQELGSEKRSPPSGGPLPDSMRLAAFVPALIARDSLLRNSCNGL